MWDEIQKQIDVELEQLNQLIQTYQPLIQHCLQTKPDDVERLAIAELIHSFYTGIENIFKRIVKEVDKTIIPGFDWHRQLLETVSKPASSRRNVISVELKLQLHEYLSFRHVFRQAYSFQLNWEKMKHLVENMETLFEKFKTEINTFSQDT